MSRVTVVLSQAPGKHPAKRALEEDLAAALLMESGLDVSVVPNLYDLDAQHTGRLFLESVPGDMIVLSWLYPRAAFWLLDRDGIRGHFGETLLKSAEEEEDVDEAEQDTATDTVGTTGELPDRYIYTLSLKDAKSPTPFIEEIRRIAAECAERHRHKQTANPTMVELGLPTANKFEPEELLADTKRRWYPVIDYSRCTNCMECLDFCLFGVYGTDTLDRLLVENQDNCKRGCPACSRVCPEQAIMFPEYKTPAIAGANTGAVGSLKIDLTKLFGGDQRDALSTAVDERDRELVADGRSAVGMSVGVPKRQDHRAGQPKDDLDKLMDDLDALEI